METNPLLAKAINLAMQAHAGQTDKAGMPYIGHVMRVMQAGRTIDEKIAGVLHDIVEDTEGTTIAYNAAKCLHQKATPKKTAMS